MELYIPYLLSTGSIMIGSMGYSYIYSNAETDETKLETPSINNLNNIEMTDYDIIEPIELITGSTNSRLHQIINICNKYCNHNLTIYRNNKKTRKRLFRYINEYNTNGHDAFIKLHKKDKQD